MLIKKTSIYLIAGIMGLASQQANAISITFDYTYDNFNFFSSQSKKDALTAAGDFFATRLTDSLTAINSAGVNSFNANFSNPGTGATQTINDFSVATDTIVVYAGGRDLGSSTLGIGGPGGFSAGGTQSFVDNLQTRGQGSNTTEFGPWGGAISFNTTSAWHFDSDVSTKENFSGQFDFYSVAIHEIGHLLGLGTANSWDTLLNTAGEFIGTASAAINGGNVGLASGLAHWANGTQGTVNGNLQEAAMDPSISTNTRKYFTDLDLAGLTDVGWEVTAVPVPAAAYLFGTALIGLFGLRKKSCNY